MGGHTGGEEKKRKEKKSLKHLVCCKGLTHVFYKFFAKGTQNDEKIPHKNKKHEKAHTKDTGVMHFNQNKLSFLRKKVLGNLGNLKIPLILLI
jgi:hypothetical protein